MNEEKALAVLETLPEEKRGLLPSIGSDSNYDPHEVRKTLKLLAEGDLTEEQLEEYEKDDGRLRAYVALKSSAT